MSFQINGLQHIGIPVSDIEVSKKWYSDVLGFNVVHQTEVHNDEDDVKAAFIKQGNLIIELYQLSGEELDKVKARSHGHVDHIALDVDNIDDVYLIMESKGIKVLEGKPKYLPFWEKGVRFITILGPDNEKIEFNQRLKE